MFEWVQPWVLLQELCWVAQQRGTRHCGTGHFKGVTVIALQLPISLLLSLGQCWGWNPSLTHVRQEDVAMLCSFFLSFFLFLYGCPVVPGSFMQGIHFSQ